MITKCHITFADMRSCCGVEAVQFYHRRNEEAIWTEEIGFGFSLTFLRMQETPGRYRCPCGGCDQDDRGDSFGVTQ